MQTRRKRKGVDRYNLNEQEIIHLYIEEKKSIEDIRKIFKVSYGTIKLRLVRNNISLRSQSESKKITMNKPEVKQKISEACKHTNEQRKQTNLKLYGTEVPASNPEIRNRWQQKYIKKHGISYAKDPNRINKIKQTSLEKYGVDNPSKHKGIQKKISEQRWKNKSEEDLKQIQNKSKLTCLERLGVEHPMKNNSIKQKIQERWFSKSKEEQETIKKRISKTQLENKAQRIISRLPELNVELLEPYQGVTKEVKVRCTKCQTTFKTTIDYISHSYGLCPKCYPRKVSYWEKEVSDFITQLVGKENVIRNSRKILDSNKELDIYILSKNLAIECDGIYYHSDKFCPNPQKYHLEKTEECLSKGIRLIHIFEDEWMFKQDIVKSRIENILGVSDKQVVYARKCLVKPVDVKQKDEFLDKYHIQGKDISSIRLGLFYNSTLVSIMTFSKGSIAKGSKVVEGIWELNRFCSNYNYRILGAAGKLLEYFKKNYDWKEIFSYTDRRWSNGNLYNKIDFELIGVTKPNYWYVKNCKRIHRFNLRKRQDEPKDMPEWILRLQEGYQRIWDCGNLKFRLKQKN